jgi:hypothetical protein
LSKVSSVVSKVVHGQHTGVGNDDIDSSESFHGLLDEFLNERGRAGIALVYQCAVTTYLFNDIVG